MSSILSAAISKPREGGPSFSLKHRLVRLAWCFVWTFAAAWTPVPLHFWRRFLLRTFGAKIHRTAKVYPRVKIWYPPNLSMDAFSCLANHVDCYAMDKISLGQYSIVSQGASLCCGGHNIDDAHFQLVTRPIVIGPNAWVAAEAFVGGGVNVGEGAVLGARAVTFKDLDAYSVYVGNPAKFLRRRQLPENGLNDALRDEN